MTLKDYLNTGDRFAAGSGARLVEIAPGLAVAELKVTSAHLNAGGVCQGGAIFTLADLVFAALVNQGENPSSPSPTWCSRRWSIRAKTSLSPSIRPSTIMCRHGKETRYGRKGIFPVPTIAYQPRKWRLRTRTASGSPPSPARPTQAAVPSPSTRSSRPRLIRCRGPYRRTE